MEPIKTQTFYKAEDIFFHKNNYAPSYYFIFFLILGSI